MSSPKATRRAARQAAKSLANYRDSSDESDSVSQGSDFGEQRGRAGLKRKRGNLKNIRSTKRKGSISSKLSDLTPLTSPASSQQPWTEHDTEAGQHSTESSLQSTRMVWIRVDCEGHPAAGHDAESFWWPAKVQSTSLDAKPSDVTFYDGLCDGKPPLHNIDSTMLLPFFNASQQPRFSCFSEAIESSRIDNVGLSANQAKRDSTELAQRWSEAVAALERDATVLCPPIPHATTTALEIPDIDLTMDTSTDEDLPDVRVAHSKSFNPNNLFRRRHHSFSAETRDDYTSMGSLCTTAATGSEAVDDINDTDEEMPDPNITIPGEGVLARTGRKANEYWPARITEFVPGSKNRRARYRVQWFDNTAPQLIARTHFYIQEEDEFYTCPLGAMRGGKQAKDLAEDDNYDDQEFRCSPSPEPTLPAPPAADFVRQPIRSQLQYLKPVLIAIILNNYPPARPRHDDFIAGGKRRLTVTKRAYNKGDLSVPEYRQLESCLRWWCLRDENKPPRGNVSAIYNVNHSTVEGEAELNGLVAANTTLEVLPPELAEDTTNTTNKNDIQISEDTIIPGSPRPQGCPEYEALSPMDRLEYCMNVLLPEAVIQLLLWQCGERKVLELQSDEIERQLWDIGNKLSEQEDWVWRILNNRQKRQSRLPKLSTPAKQLTKPVKTPATSGRPRRGTRS